MAADEFPVPTLHLAPRHSLGIYHEVSPSYDSQVDAKDTFGDGVKVTFPRRGGDSGKVKH